MALSPGQSSVLPSTTEFSPVSPQHKAPFSPVSPSTKPSSRQQSPVLPSQSPVPRCWWVARGQGASRTQPGLVASYRRDHPAPRVSRQLALGATASGM